MPKRLTNTEKWKTSFFKNLPGPYQLLWLYVNDDCDFCGIWIVDFEVAGIRINGINEKEALEFFKNEIQVLPSGDWFIPSFIENQYGAFSEKNAIHRKVAATLTAKHAVCEGYVKSDHSENTLLSHCSTVDKNKNKNKTNTVIQKENKKEPAEIQQLEIAVWPTFDDFWDLYDKKVDRAEVEVLWKKLKQDEKEAIMLHVPDYKIQEPNKKYRKHPSTYINKKSWTNEIYNNYEQPGKPTGTAGRHEPFTEEVSRTIQDKFATVAKQRAEQRQRNQPSPQPLHD